MPRKANAKVLFTQEGFDELKAELEELKEKKLPALVDRVAKARAQGDLSENADYTNSKEELEFTENRISELEDVIAKAKVVKKDNGKSKTIKLGSKVLVAVKGREQTFTIVGEFESNPRSKKISQESPLGQALFGKKEGEEVEVKAPSGTLTYKIKKVN